MVCSGRVGNLLPTLFVLNVEIKTRGQEIATPDFRQARNDTTVSDKSLTAVCRLAHPTAAFRQPARNIEALFKYNPSSLIRLDIKPTAYCSLLTAHSHFRSFLFDALQQKGYDYRFNEDEFKLFFFDFH